MHRPLRPAACRATTAPRSHAHFHHRVSQHAQTPPSQPQLRCPYKAHTSVTDNLLPLIKLVVFTNYIQLTASNFFWLPKVQITKYSRQIKTMATYWNKYCLFFSTANYTIKAKFHYAIWFKADRRQVESWWVTSFESVCDQLRTR